MLLGALTTFGPLSMDLYLPGMPAMTDDLSASPSQAQLTITAFMVGMAAGQFLAGPVSDALGRRRPLLAGLAVYAATSALCALAPSITTLVALRVAQGIAGATGIVIARAMVRDRTAGGSDTARVFAMLMLIMGIAPMVAPIAGGLLLEVTDWRGTFGVLGLIGAALLTAALLQAPETLPPARRHRGGLATSRAAMAELLRDRAFVAYALCLGLSFATLTAYLAGASFLLEEVHGLSPFEFGLVFGVNALGMVLAAQLSARMVATAGPRRMLGAGLALGGVAGTAFLVATLLNAGLAVLLVCLWLLIASRGMVNPNAQALAMSEYPHAAGTASGLMGVFQFGIGGLAAPLAGIGGAEATLPMAVLMAATGLAAAAVLALAVHRRRAAAVV
ncbi:MAG TPA: multidrug effflux MFS transporter [Capillimicrobium sp.]|nr:multidrug effflux MFS transporter [Capillimicrobium sp.]